MSNKLALIAKDFTPEKVDLIKRTVAQGATDDELELFLYQSQRTGLDPLARQIVFSKFNTKNGPRVSIITSIDGYRLLADRTGKYAGNDDPIFEGEPNPIKASVTVYKLVSGVRCPFTAAARWSEYCPSDGKDFMWRKMPHLMLGKCAEALALRKAFPAELSGLYTDTEMEQAGYVEASYTVEETTKKAEQPKTAQAEAPKTNGNGKPKAQPAENPDTFFAKVQKATDNYYGHGKEGKGKEHLYNTLKRWPKFGDPDDVEAALSEAVDHAKQRRQQEAEPVSEDEIPF